MSDRRTAVAMIQASMLEPPQLGPGPGPGAAPPRLRLPGRHLRLLAGRPALGRLVERVASAETVAKVVVALSVAPEDEVLVPAARAAGAEVFRGSVQDLTGRLVSCGEWLGLGGETPVVRVGADSPLIDPRYLDMGVDALLSTHAGAFEFQEDQAEELCPGLSAGFLRLRALRHIDRRARTAQHRSDPLSYAYDYPEEVELRRLPLPQDLSYLLGRHRLLLQTAEDLALLEAIYLRLYSGGVVSTAAALQFLDSDPVLASLNQGVLRRGPTLPMAGAAGWRMR